MWQWTYSGAKLQNGGIAVEIKSKADLAPDQTTEWLEARLEIGMPASPSEPMMRLEALRKLRTLVSGEIDRLEDRLADGVR